MSESLRGQYLIAGKHLRDRNFYKTVVLMVEHGPDGAMGFVVNRPSSVTVAHVLSEHFKLPETDDLVFLGGPVDPSALFILHNSSEFDHNERPVLPGLYVGSSGDAFETIVRSAAEENADLQYRIFSGCAGWGSDQLEGELARGDWLVHPAESGAIFCVDPYEFWDYMLKKVQKSYNLIPQCKSNPEWN